MVNPVNFIPLVLVGATPAPKKDDPSAKGSKSKPACAPASNPPDKTPHSYPAGSFVNCDGSRAYFFRPNVQTEKLYPNQPAPWEFLNQAVGGFHNIDKVTWKQMASYIYGIPEGDPRLDAAAKVLQDANGGEKVKTPYDTLTSGGFDYYAFCVTDYIPTDYLKYGHLPTIALVVPPLPAMCGNDIKAPADALQNSINGLNAQIAKMQAAVKADPKLVVSLTYMDENGKKQTKSGQEALDMAAKISADAQAKLNNAKTLNDCAMIAEAIKELNAIKLRVDDTTRNLHTPEPKVVSTPSKTTKQVKQHVDKTTPPPKTKKDKEFHEFGNH